jgi:leucyl aminopeptidase
VGLGTLKSVVADDWRKAGAIAVNQAAELKAARLVIGWAGKLDPDAAALQALAEGAAMAGYRYAAKGRTTPPAWSRWRPARGVASALRTAGGRVGHPCANHICRQHRAAPARAGGLRCRVHGTAALRRLKMTAILAVNQGSAQEPFPIMEYRAPRARRTLCIVGKGLTFDSGGISIKPADKMDEMKYDMCGAGAVLGLMRTLSILRPPGLRVIGIVGTTENMPGPAAYKPGDVVRAASGKTIEVINTDAEGRVVLADAIHYATRFKPEAIVDLATLTGAIVISWARGRRPVLQDDRWPSACWRPRRARRAPRRMTYDEYGDKIKSSSPTRNSSGRAGLHRGAVPVPLPTSRAPRHRGHGLEPAQARVVRRGRHRLRRAAALRRADALGRVSPCMTCSSPCPPSASRRSTAASIHRWPARSTAPSPRCCTPACRAWRSSPRPCASRRCAPGSAGRRTTPWPATCCAPTSWGPARRS